MSMVERAVERDKRSAAARFVRAVRRLQRMKGLDAWALSLVKRAIEGDWGWALRYAFRLGQYFAAFEEAEGVPSYANWRADEIARCLTKFGKEVQRVEKEALHPPMM